MTLKDTHLLLLEDEPLVRRRLAGQLQKYGTEVTLASNVAEARRLLRSLDFDFALFDVNLPDGSCLKLFEEKVVPASVVVVVMTAEGGVSGAVEAMRLGAAEYLVKPFDVDDLCLRLLRGRRDQQARRGSSFHREQQAAVNESFCFGPALAGVQTHLGKILEADRRIQGPLPPVLIEGETGTGKTTLARWLHDRGPRSQGPLIEVNCSALPDALAESELFGHERGAFTDAKEARIGLLEAAEGGTLFLDELPSLSISVQAKLLKAIEDRSIRRVGGNRQIAVDARIIAATNSDLRELVTNGRFRGDLLHRLDLFRIRIPPLRERGDDIILLANTLLARIAKTYKFSVGQIPPIGVKRLLAYSWPGNVRELAHEIERSLVFDEQKLIFSGLANTGLKPDGIAGLLNQDFRFPAVGFSLETLIDALIERALDQSGGNVSATARLLGVQRDFLRYRLKRLRPRVLTET